MMKKKWYCLNCEKFVDTYIDIFKGFALCCKKCGSSRLMKLEDMNKKEFKRLSKAFKDRTGKVS